MRQQSSEEFFVERQRAAAAYVNGDAAAVEALIPHDGEASFHSPGGDSVSGAAKVAERYSDDAKNFGPSGESRFEVLQMEAGEEIAFWTGFQVATVRMKGKDQPIEMRIRVTEVFSRIDGGWRMIHRHADMGAPKKPERRNS
jgi:ketosteroid isomerase-like protein